jgi:protein involved in polysaccharide export with SLBB domain
MRKSVSLVLGFLIAWNLCVGQVTSQQPTDLEKALQQRALQSATQKEEALEKLTTFPMEKAIDPKVYIVGPSDVLNVAVWGPVSFNYPLPVTPEGTLIIPTVGEIYVADQKLADVKSKASSLVRKRYPTGDISVTLVKPRAFIVSLIGSVMKPGQYLATAVDRVEKIIDQGAGEQFPNATFTIPAYVPDEGIPLQSETIKAPRVTETKKLYKDASTRNILLIRRNRDTLRVDIPKFYATHDDRYNPFLLDGDIILVPQKILKKNFVAVFGAVNAPGEYEYAEGDRLLDLIGIANGLLPTADPENVVLSRLDPDGLQAEERAYSLTAIRAGKEPNPLLQPGCRILVKEKNHLTKGYSVTVAGEVRSAGIYPIAAEGTKLLTIIRDAGGLTEHALLSGSYVLRKDDQLKDIVDPRLELLRNLRTHELNLIDSTIFLLDLKVGRRPVVADLKKLIEGGDSTQDVVLRDEDIVYIASDLHSVLVQGQVANPGYIAYVPGASCQYYIDKAGGYSELAVEGDTRIIKKGTLEWVEPEKTVIESGDQIWVPKEPRKTFAYYFAIMRDASQIAAAIVSITYLIVAIRTLSK